MSRRFEQRIREKAWLQAWRSMALFNQGGRCFYCLTALTQATVTADHKMPRSKNGANNMNNIAAACRPCNDHKDKMTDAQFQQLLKSSCPATLQVQILRSIRRINLAADRAVKRIYATASLEDA
jgi:hypothetical protein